MGSSKKALTTSPGWLTMYMISSKFLMKNPIKATIAIIPRTRFNLLCPAFIHSKRHRIWNPDKNPTSLTRASGAPTRRIKSSRVVVTVVPNPRHGKLLALLDVTRGKLVKSDTKKPAPEYPTAGAVPASGSTQTAANAFVLCSAQWKKRRRCFMIVTFYHR